MLRDMMMLMKKAPPVVLTYATWNPSDKSVYITLSSGNLTAAAHGSANYANMRSTISKSSGKWYWETTLSATFSSQSHGICTSSHLIDNTFIGGSAAYGVAAGWHSGGNVYVNAVQTPAGTTYVPGDVLGFALDADAGTTNIYKNGAFVITIGQGTGNVFAAQSLYESTNTTNFGATPFIYTPPAGHNAGLYV